MRPRLAYLAIAALLLGWGSGGSQQTGAQASSAARAYGFYANDDIQFGLLRSAKEHILLARADLYADQK